MSLFFSMHCWIVVFLSAQIVTAVSNVREQHKLNWCSYFNSYAVYTVNQWTKCQRHNAEDKINYDVFRQSNKILRVAVAQDVADFRHDCWATTSKNGQIVLEKSYSSFILTILQDVLKFKYTIVSSHRKIDNSTAKSRDLLVQLLVEDQADIGVCHLTFTPSRIDAVSFLHSTLVSGRALVFDPSHLSLLEDIFVLTFSTTLWICFFVAVALLIICFRFSTWMHSSVRPDHEPWSWFEVLLWAIAAVCQQSYSRHPKGLSCRTTYIIGYAITYLLYTGFTAGVTSLLAVQGRGVELTLDDVFSMKLTLVTTAHTTHHAFIKGLGEKEAHFEKRIKTKVVNNHEQLFKSLDSDNVVGFGSTVNLENYIREKIPVVLQKEFMISELAKTRTQESLIVQKNSPYLEAFNYWLMRMQEAGLLSLGQDRFLTVPLGNGSDQPGWSSASLSNVLSAVLILTAGYFFSVLILFCEMAWMRKKTSTLWELRTKKDVLLNYQHFHRPKHSIPD